MHPFILGTIIGIVAGAILTLVDRNTKHFTGPLTIFTAIVIYLVLAAVAFVEHNGALGWTLLGTFTGTAITMEGYNIYDSHQNKRAAQEALKRALKAGKEEGKS